MIGFDRRSSSAKFAKFSNEDGMVFIKLLERSSFFIHLNVYTALGIADILMPDKSNRTPDEAACTIS